MFILTQNNEIINLHHYPRVCVQPNTGSELIAVTALAEQTFDPRKDTITIAIFDNSMDADYARNDLFKAIATGRPAWNVNAIKSLSDIWNKVKADNESLPLINKAELSVSNLNELTITYPSYYRGTENVDNNIEIVKPELQKALCGDSVIITGPEFSDDLNS